MRNSFVVLSLSGLILLAWLVPPVATAAGPWKAQVVDAEGKQPLEGVVVVAVWTRHVRSFGGPSSEYYDSQEVLTDKEGRFTIAPRSFFSLNPFVFFRGPDFLIFKPGYGRTLWPGYKDYDTWPEEKRKKLTPYSNLFQLDGIVIEMPRLKALEERKEYLGRVGVGFSTVPTEKSPLLEAAMTEERKALGYRN